MENTNAVDKTIDSVCQEGALLRETSAVFPVSQHQSFHHGTTVKDAVPLQQKETAPNVPAVPAYTTKEIDLVNHQPTIYRSLPSINLISPSSIPSPSVSAKQSILKPDGPFQPYGSYLYSIPGFSAFQPLQYTPVSANNTTINTNVKIGCSSNTNYPVMSSMQNVVKSEVQTLPVDKITTACENFDGNVIDKVHNTIKEIIPISQDKGPALMETDFEEQFLTEIVPQTKSIKPTTVLDVQSKKTVQFLPQLILSEDNNSMQSQKLVCQGVNDDRFSLKTSIPISKIDMRSITSHTDTVFSPDFIRALPTSKAFSAANETFDSKLIEVPTAKQSEEDSSDKTARECQAVHESKPIEQVFLHSSSPEMVAGSAKANIDCKISANIVSTTVKYKTIIENDVMLPLGFEGKNHIFSNINSEETRKSTASIGCSATSEILINRPAVLNKPAIENFPIDGLKSNIKTNEPEHKKKYVFVPATNVNNPKLMLAISQKPSNPNSILVTKGKIQEERLPSRMTSVLKKPKDNLLLADAVPEQNSKVVALKRLHQDNGDENDFENLITENQIYGNKIVIKEKATPNIASETILPTKKPKTTECTSDTDLQAGNFMVQPNILYVSNLQLQQSSPNFVMLGNKPIYSQMSTDDQKFLIKADASDNNTVLTSLSSDINQHGDIQSKVLVGQTFRSVNPITHTVSYVKTNNVIEPVKPNNVLQNLLNKPNLKTNEGQIHQKIVGQRVVGQLVSNQILYQVPMIIDREGGVNRTVNVMKPGCLNSELAMLLSKQPNHQTEEWKSNTTRLMQVPDRKETDKPKNIEKNEATQNRFKTYVMNVKPDSPVEEVVSSLDLAEKRRRIKRKKKYLSQDVKTQSKDSVHKPAESRKNNNKLVHNRCSGSHDREDCDENDTQSDEEENFSKGNLFITNGPTLPLDSSGEKMDFLNMFELTTKVGKNEKELEKLERSLKQDAVSQARLAVIDSAPITTNDQISDANKASLQKSPSPQIDKRPQVIEYKADASAKASFFNGINLKPVSNEHRKEYEYLWTKFIAKNRKSSLILNEYFEKSSHDRTDDVVTIVEAIDHSIDLHGQLRRMTEIKRSVTENNNLIKKKLDKMYCASFKDDNEEVEIPLLAELNFCEITKLSNMANRSLKMLRSQQNTSESSEYDAKYSSSPPQCTENMHKEQRFKSDGYVPNICIPSVPKIISLKSMQHSNSVDISPATSMDEPRNSAAGSKGLEFSESMSIKVDHSKTNEASPSGRRSTVDASCQAYRWPGIAAVLESYRRYNEEREDDKESLISGAQRLHKELAESKTEAVSLNNDLRQALAEQQMCEEQRRSIQRSLDVLNGCIRQISSS